MLTALRAELSLFLIIALPLAASGVTADDYFHSAAQHYIHGKHQSAKTIIAEGLQKYPDDPKLAALKGLIKDPEKQNQDKKQNQNQDQQNDQDKKDRDKDEQQNRSAKNDKQQEPPQPGPQKRKDDMKKKKAERIVVQFADDADSLNKPPKKAARLRKPEKDW